MAKRTAKKCVTDPGADVRTYADIEKVLGIKIDRNLTSPESAQRLFRGMNTARSDIGSINPYAAVEHELGIMIDWRNSPPQAVENLLAKRGMDYFTRPAKKPAPEG